MNPFYRASIQWSEFIKQWESMDSVSVDRKLLVENCYDIQLHSFCDASNIGYGACIYIRSRGRQGKTCVRLLCAKSRVAPLKTVTIPRLELCGALLLAQLFREANDALDLAVNNKKVFWSDSTVVLHWLKTPPHLLKTYVANRVANIQDITDAVDWRHVKSENNLMDAISRGQTPREFSRNRVWFAGPSWLFKDESEWPDDSARLDQVPELKDNICLASINRDFDILLKFSSYIKLIRIIAYCLRFNISHKYSGPLCAEEINEAEIRVLKLLQGVRFSDEIIILDKGSKNKSKFANLDPFLDRYGLIRIGGRLQMSELTFAEKHPILLPNRHHLTDCIIRKTHEKYFHPGVQTTLYIL
ncbi:uncharacterized protein [Mycetomoellerius zeteki]|uniref:uncharacterized protein n=1 Tax=Mycetomoellerius zeteki TaxID=64791 RepID=UPI00084ECCEB|nr:PREDICTED: uncharacterized protein LOC108724526 [Trachymyrmex zeteki]